MMRFKWADDVYIRMTPEQRAEEDRKDAESRARMRKLMAGAAAKRRTPSIEEGGCDVCDDPNCRHNAHPHRPTEAQAEAAGDLLDEAMGMAPSDKPEPERG